MNVFEELDMKKILILFLLLSSISSELKAQLLEDTDRRLKRAKVERQGFLFFGKKKKIGKSEGVPVAKKDVSPRFSSPKEKAKKYSAGVRSSGGVVKFKTFSVSPKYSAGSPFDKNNYRISPRYSKAGSPFHGMKFNIAPRYSDSNPFRANQYQVSPRYSKEMPFRGKEYNISPRYSNTKIGFHKILFNKELSMSSYYRKTSLWKGNAKNERSNVVLRQWNQFWAKLNGNLPKDRGVKNPDRKAKFDKKERVIWNN